MWRVLKYGAAAAVLLVVLLIASMYVEHRLPLTLPAPPGPYVVGRTTAVWSNGSRALAMWIWYPSVAGSAKPADYFPPSWRGPLARHQAFVMRDLLTRDPAVVRAHAMADAPLAPSPRPWPVILLRSGVGALATDYTTLAESLASAGYVVVGWDTPGSTFVVVYPDGRVVTRTREGDPPENLPESERRRIAENLISVWTSDARFVADRLSQFNDHLDLDHLGIIGHSFGGATAAQFCHDDPRCAAGIDLDGQPFGSVVRDGVRRPFLIVLSDHGAHADPASARIYANLVALHAPMMTVAGANHFSFSDQILLKSRILLKTLETLHVLGPLDGRRGLAITASIARKFFDEHLKP